jgi:hypothetical protein
MELFPLAPSQGSRTCARWPLCLALGVVRRRMYLAAVASPTERPLRVVHPFLVPQCLKEPGLPSPDKLREYANVGSFRWSVLGRGMFIHASASGTRLQQNAHLRRVFLKKEEFTRRFESVISFHSIFSILANNLVTKEAFLLLTTPSGRLIFKPTLVGGRPMSYRELRSKRVK